MTDAFEISISSDFGLMKKALYFVLAQIKEKKPCIEGDDFMDLRLIFTELLTNAIIHGNKYNTQKRVYIFIEFTDEGILSKIMDEGNGFDFTEVLRSRDPIENLLSETGRGIQLVRSAADELTFIGKGNEVKFSKKVGYVMSEEPIFTYKDQVCTF